ncbi:MAG: HEAT repeat domain-containing protein [Verrucomicrobia bacterium]|nr:HEAT repeat domain-containing protein [Verrucomicrobiota bacterium]
MMLYSIDVQGFEGHAIAVEVSVFINPRLLIDGQPAPPGQKRLEYLLGRDDGSIVTARLQPSAMGSSFDLVIEDRVIPIMEPLQWHQWAWIGVPFLLVIGGGCIGGFCGGLATVINLRIFRSQANVSAQYALTGIVSAVSLGAYIFVASVFQFAFFGFPKDSRNASGGAKQQAASANPQGRSSSGASSQKPTPVAAAHSLLANGAGNAESALSVLKDTQNEDALELLLSILEYPNTGNDVAPKAVKSLSAWKTDHEKIAEALIAEFPAVSSQAKDEICRALCAWDMKAFSPELARMILDSKDFGFNGRIAEQFKRIITPECAPALLAALPSPAKLPTGRNDAAEIIGLLGETRDSKATPQLIEHLNNRQSFALWRPASVALGKIGTEEAVAAIENRMQEIGRTNLEQRRMFLDGLHRSHHPHGRAALSESLAGNDTWDRADAADALVETATVEDAQIVAAVMQHAHPQMRLRVSPALLRLLPDAQAAVEAMYDAAIQSRRFRTALSIAQALNDKPRTAHAQDGLQQICQSMMQEPRLDRWFGRKKEDVLAKYPDAKIQRHVRTATTPTQIIQTDWGSTLDAPDRFSFWGGHEAAGPFVGVATLDKCDQPVYGVRLGDAGDLAWEILGGIQQSAAMWGAFSSQIQLPEGTAVWVYWTLDSQDKVSRLEIRPAKK